MQTSTFLGVLRVLDKRDRSFVLKQAVGRIFEDINSKLYPIS
jgi:hypothetical protein